MTIHLDEPVADRDLSPHRRMVAIRWRIGVTRNNNDKLQEHEPITE